jgi:hypothetical protein
MSDQKKQNRSPSAPTSGNREESMSDSGKDAFNSKNPVRGSSTSSSGTTGLGGESRDADRIEGPGGVEGESGNK